jgi:hypothetical protein
MTTVVQLQYCKNIFLRKSNLNTLFEFYSSSYKKAMNNYRSAIFFKDLVREFSLIYLFYTLVNLFFIPNSTTLNYNESISAHVSITRQAINVDHNRISCFRLGERSIIDEDQLNNGKSALVYFLLPFKRFSVSKLKTISFFTPKAIIHNSRHYFLSLCILRI